MVIHNGVKESKPVFIEVGFIEENKYYLEVTRRCSNLVSPFKSSKFIYCHVTTKISTDEAKKIVFVMFAVMFP